MLGLRCHCWSVQALAIFPTPGLALQSVHARIRNPGSPLIRHPGSPLNCWLALQSVRALELLGQPLEKQKYKSVVLAATRRAQRARQRGGAGAASFSVSASASLASADLEGGGGAMPASGAEGRRRAAEKNVYLERFKFWLGLPNAYYNSSSDGEEEGL